jgi:aminomethyltransferase
MKDYQVRYGLVCNETGGIRDDILVYRWPYGYAAVINAGNREKILAWLQTHAAGTNVQIMDQTFDTTMVAVQGPKSVDLVAGMFADDVSTLKYYYAKPTRYRDKNCVVSRTGYTGEDGFEIMVPNALGETLWDDLLARGALPCGLGARDTLRLEAAMPLYGHELNETTDPLQAGLGWAVKLDKGDFIGRDALKDAAELPPGIRPERIGLVLEGKRAAREGSPILADATTPIGVVTSGSFVPHLEQSIAMGYALTKHAFPGAKVLVDAKGSHLPATVVPLPFYKRAR